MWIVAAWSFSAGAWTAVGAMMLGRWMGRRQHGMKPFKRLAREQGVKLVRNIGDLAADDGARLTDEEFESWTAAMRELREP